MKKSVLRREYGSEFQKLKHHFQKLKHKSWAHLSQRNKELRNVAQLIFPTRGHLV